MRQLAKQVGYMTRIIKIHRYLGLSISLIVLLISLTGVLLVWKKEFLWVAIAPSRELPVTDLKLQDAALAIVNSYDQNEVLLARFYFEGLSLHKVWLADQRYAFHDQFGQQIQVWEGNDRFEDWLLTLHSRLLAGDVLGKHTIGLTGLSILVLVSLGLFMFWTRRKSYSFNLFPQSTRYLHIRKSHSEVGVTIFLPVLVVAITGVVLIYPTESRTILRDGFSEPPPLVKTQIQPKRNQVSSQQSDQPLWFSAFEIAEKRFPDSQIKWLSFPAKGLGTFAIGVQEPTSWDRMGRTQIRYEGDNVWTLQQQSDQRVAHTLFDFFYSMHSAKLPFWYRGLLSLTGFLLAWLSFLGIVSFFKRRSNKALSARKKTISGPTS